MNKYQSRPILTFENQVNNVNFLLKIGIYIVHKQFFNNCLK